MSEARERAGTRAGKTTGTAKDAAALRTFPVLGLQGQEGRAVFKVGGDSVYAVDVRGGMGTLTTTADGPTRVMGTCDSRETVEAIVEGRLHPIVAALQNRLGFAEGSDRRFALSVLLALRASAPAFTQGRG